MLFLLASLLSLGFQDTLYPEWKQTFAVEEMIHQEASLAIFRNSRFGRMLAIDGVIRLAENDEFIYHEMMAHVPLLAHGEVKSLLIIGGGNGALLREALRHPTLEKVVLVEIDPSMIVLSKKYFPELSSGAFDDPRATIVIQDAARYVKETEETFDLILSDSDQFECYADCKAILNPNGIFVNQNGTPFMQKSALAIGAENRRAHFKHVQFFIAPVPTHIGGFMAFGFASDRKYKPAEKTLVERLEKVKGEMRYYNPAIHKASFALPQYMLKGE